MPRGSRILHLTAQRSLKYGGFERYLVAIAQRCDTSGVQLVVQHNAEPRSVRYVEDVRAAGGVVVGEDLAAGRVISAVRAVRLIARYRPAVVHLHFCGSWTRLAVGLIARWIGVRRTVATVHLLPGDDSRLLLRASYARLDRVLAVSHAVERALLAIGVSPGTLTTLYLGVPELDPLPGDAARDIRVRFGIPDESPIIVTVTFDSPMKGVDVLVSSFVNHLGAEYPDLHVVIVGMDEPGETIDRRAAPSCLDRVHWAGVQDDVRPFLAAADIYVQSSRAEAFGLAIVEAMRQSLPVVATKVGGIPEAVADGETGILVEPDSPTELAAAIALLVADTDLARRLGRAGCQRWGSRFELVRSVDALCGRHYGLPAC
jgi:glycosyltransferase involved in cell wall biosynthesis